MPYLQPRLFDDLPPTREDTPVHKLNYPTFASAENTMWHGRARYHNPGVSAQASGWRPEGDDPVHVGTFEAAAHRGLGKHVALRTDRDPSGVKSPSQEYRSRTDLSEAAGTERGTQVLPFRIRSGAMSNTPETYASDAFANREVGNLPDTDEGDFWEMHQGADPESIEYDGGLYYKNENEDPGSISAVVPSSRDLQHWPSEVMAHSSNPSQRRTAEFLLGRGY